MAQWSVKGDGGACQRWPEAFLTPLNSILFNCWLKGSGQSICGKLVSCQWSHRPGINGEDYWLQALFF